MSSIISTVGSTVGSALGLGPGIGSPRLPKRPKELGRLSLSQLTKRESNLGGRESKLTESIGGRERTAGVGGLFVNRSIMKLGKTQKLLRKTTQARRKLISEGTAQRAGRATSVANLLTRGF